MTIPRVSGINTNLPSPQKDLVEAWELHKLVNSPRNSPASAPEPQQQTPPSAPPHKAIISPRAGTNAFFAAQNHRSKRTTRNKTSGNTFGLKPGSFSRVRSGDRPHPEIAEVTDDAHLAMGDPHPSRRGTKLAAHDSLSDRSRQAMQQRARVMRWLNKRLGKRGAAEFLRQIEQL